MIKDEIRHLAELQSKNIKSENKAMYPTTVKSTIIITIVSLIVLPVLIYISLDSFPIIWLALLIGFVLKAILSKTFKDVFFFTTIFSFFMPFYFIISNLSLSPEPEQFSFGIVIIAIFSITLLYFKDIPKKKYDFFKKIIEAAQNEKRNYSVIKEYPSVICSKHFRKVKSINSFGYKSMCCIYDNSCNIFKNYIIAKLIIGTIGKDEDDLVIDNCFYTNIYNHRDDSIKNADFDFIEIHENNNIINYDTIINKTVSFLYNELNRLKSLREITVIIYGDLPISKNTKRLLEEKFLKVEYFT